MKIKTSIVFLVSALLFLLYSCDSSTNPPTEEKPPGYQEDVPWPSLADSPWPMAYGTPQMTKRSKSTGGITGNIEKFEIPAYSVRGLAFGSDSVFYFPTATYLGEVSGLVAMTLDGEQKWIYEAPIGSGTAPSSPLVTSDGTIYFQANHKLYAINKDGTLKWKTDLSGDNEIITIGKDGIIYIIGSASDSTFGLIAIDSNGNYLWSFIAPKIGRVLAMAPDGKTIYITIDRKLAAFDIDSQTIKWTFITAVPYTKTLLVDSYGNIIFYGHDGEHGQCSIYCIDHDGILIWQYALGLCDNISWMVGNVTINKTGDVLALLGDILISLDYQGNLNWKIQADGNLSGPLVCDANDVIYFSSTPSIANPPYNNISAVNSEGKLIWKTSIPNESGYSLYYPFVPVEGALFVVSHLGKNIYKIN